MDGAESSRERKRARTTQDGCTEGAAAASASAAAGPAAVPSPSFPNQDKYERDPGGSGWWIHKEAPHWSYSPHQDLHYNAAEQRFYRVDPGTGAWVAVDGGAATASGGTGTAAAAQQPPQQQQQQPQAAAIPDVVPHEADHTFMQGRRPTQEDRHTMLPNFGERHLKGRFAASFYAVFDGHCGEQCSDFAAKNLHVYLAKELKQIALPPSEEDVTKAIRAACAATDREFLRIAKIRKRQDGCCCIAALLVGDDMYVVNIGDSRCVLAGGGGAATALSTDHKPENPVEKARVQKAGGQVLKYGDVWRVTSAAALAWEQAKIKQGPRPIQPAIARSFGDASLKTPRPLLICTPEVRRVKIKPDDRIALLGCDGIWDVLSNQRAVDTALEALGRGEDLRAAAGSVVKLAYEKGSTDNISVVAIRFGEAPSSPAAAAASDTLVPSGESASAVEAS